MTAVIRIGHGLPDHAAIALAKSAVPDKSKRMVLTGDVGDKKSAIENSVNATAAAAQPQTVPPLE